ncbi:unnamed protein product [Brugia pahangi]|uniref:Tub domain-containing protein n=1 Tax=Brugia pahangi TaxID=6280 RepID=A0A0N4TF45_BRUPA|nr:unnamed protein product [Brugia pahangi]
MYIYDTLSYSAKFRAFRFSAERMAPPRCVLRVVGSNSPAERTHIYAMSHSADFRPFSADVYIL